MLPYNRALDPADYSHPSLQRHAQEVDRLEGVLRAKGVPYRKDHAHRQWEYANVLRQLRELVTADHAGEVDFKLPSEITVLDTGFGGNYFTPSLASLGYAVTAADSMDYGDCTPWLIEQCLALGVEVPLLAGPDARVQTLTMVKDQTFDVTLCISTIEHVDAADFDAAWRQLCRVTKVGGYLMVTTDYFRDRSEWERSPFKGIQHTPVDPDMLDAFLSDIDVKYHLAVVGGMDLTYKGDFVENYSFVNLCLRRTA